MLRRLFLAVFVMLLVWPAIALAQTEDMTALTVETELCTGVEEMMPVGMADQFPSDVGKVCFWSKIMGCKDTTMISHVWFYKGDEMATVELPVRSPSWRTYSCKTIPPAWAGDWVVKIMDAEGNVLKALPFKVGETTAKVAAEKEAPAPSKEAPAPEKKAPAETEQVEDSTGAGQ